MKRVAVHALWACASAWAAGAFPSEEAQRRQDSLWFARNPHSLPRWETLQERKIRKTYFAGVAARPKADRPAPPAGPLRQPAEFERVSLVFVRYPFGITTALMKELSREAVLYCMAAASQQAAARQALTGAGVEPDRLRFVDVTTDSYWTRDFTPWPVFDANGKPGLIDFTYNRPRANDDAAATAIGKALGLPVHFLDLLHAGGNYMSDGYGVSASTELVYEENMTEKRLASGEVDRRMAAALGQGGYLVPDDPTGTYIKHIDCWGKFLAPDKVLVRRVPERHAQYQEIEMAAQYFAAKKSSYGRNYRVYRVDTPNDEPYTNSLIINGAVMMATTGGANDAAALEAYRKAMPGYRVMGFTGTWESTDALHCRTFGMVDPGLLHISHLPLGDTVEAGPGGYALEATLAPHSGRGLIADSLALFYKTAAQTAFSRIALLPAGPSRYRASIPAPSANAEIAYYLHAADSSGRRENHPFMGDADPHRFTARVISSGISRQGKGTSRQGLSREGRAPDYDLRGRRDKAIAGPVFRAPAAPAR